MRIALATCLRPPEPDPDEKPLLAALRSLGAEASLLAWDDPKADFGLFDLCVIRSTWNYIHHPPEFLRWTRSVSRRTRLMNPPDVVRWNSDKRYLRELAASGLPVVPTAFHPKGGKSPLSELLSRRGWDDVVIKPRVGAASFKTRRFPLRRLDEAERFLRSASAERPMMIQPYLRSVETRGERSVIYVGGELTHAIRKNPRLAGDEEGVSGALKIADDERRLALRALKPFRDGLLYARVDLVRDEAGRLMLMELELIEPSLFLLQAPRALKLLARRCLERASG